MNSFSRYKYHIAAILTVSIWGMTFVSTKILIVNGLPPAEIFFLRFLLAYAGIWLISPRRLWASSLRDEAILMAAGACGGSLYFLTENIALEFSPASNVSLIVCTAPLWTSLLVSACHRSERLTLRQVVGSMGALAGMTLVVLNGRFILQLSPKGDLLALVSAFSWAFYSLIINKIGTKYPALFITRKVFFYGLVTLLPYFILQPPVFDPTVLARPIVWGNILFLGIIASMLCYASWNAVMKHLGTMRATNYIYLNPVVTMLTAALCIDERITPTAIAGATMILIGMWWVERK